MIREMVEERRGARTRGVGLREGQVRKFMHLARPPPGPHRRRRRRRPESNFPPDGWMLLLKGPNKAARTCTAKGVAVTAGVCLVPAFRMLLPLGRYPESWG